MYVNKSSFVLILLLFCVTYLCNAENEKLEVVTATGVVQGHYLNSRGRKQFVAFQGIPYAKPPVGELRFKPPQPSEPWDGVLNATQDPNICVQRNIYLGSHEIEGQEDCLYLNVYTPQLPDETRETKLRPVMVWIHGGGWLSGGGILGFYSPAHLLDRDVVLVGFNYRLGALGFLSTGDKVCPGNNGMKDQVMALRWVRDNIAAFGGDPNSVTIFGQSAGGASVHYHVISRMSRGLFHHAISMSGSAFCPWAFAPGGSAKHLAEKIAVLLNCPTDSSENLVACLEKKDATEIIGTDWAFTEWDWHPRVPFRPVIETEVADGDEKFLTKDPRVAVAEQDLAPVPWMAGLTSGEGALVAVGIFQDEKLLGELNDDFDRIAPMSLFYRNTSNKADEITRKVREYYFGEHPIDRNAVYEVVDMYTDAFMTADMAEAVKAHVAADVAPAFYYVFDHRGTHTYAAFIGDATLYDYGVSHGDDLLCLFPFGHFFPGIIPSEDDEKVVDILTTLWSNFAEFGNPTPEITDLISEKWLPATSSEQHYFHISSEVYASTDLLRERTEFWTSLPIRDKYPAPVRDEL